MDALLRVRYSAEGEHTHRDAVVVSYLSNEISKFQPKFVSTRSLDDLLMNAEDLLAMDIAVIRNRCLFYACDDLIALLVRKRIRTDAIAHEEAVLYVQDRLQRDDFRRIRNFQVDKGASFVTYMWQVINNLLLDFLRARSKRPKQTESYDVESQEDAVQLAVNRETSNGFAQHEASAESILEAKQLQEMLVELLSEPKNSLAGSYPIREQLRKHINLSSKERVFLKALFQYDLTINEVRELPGFAMSPNEAYRFYYRIMEQLLDSFKNAGVLDDMRALIIEAAPRVSLSIDGNTVTIAATEIHYLEQLDRSSTGCHADFRGATVFAVSHESFGKLSKRLAAYFSPIDSTTAVSDKILAATSNDWANNELGNFVIAGVVRSFRIGKRQSVELKKRFAAKSPA